MSNVVVSAADTKIEELTVKINRSLEQTVRLLLQIKKRVADMEDRLTKYNERAGHKI